MSYNVSDIYKEMELHLIESMKRNLSRHINEEENEGFNWSQWQAEKMKELKRYQRKNADIIGTTENQVSKGVSSAMRKQFREGSKISKKEFKLAKKLGYQPQSNLKQSFFSIDDRRMNNLVKSVNDDLKIANNATLRMINDQYREVIFKASNFASSEVMTSKQAIDMATKDFLSRGLNSIQYKDGRRVNIASYSQMAVRTAEQRAMLQGEGEFRRNIGNPLVKVPSHGSSCDICSKFEGKVLIDDVYSGGTSKDGKYMLLSAAMQEGLFHPNCKHPLVTYYKELDNIEFDEYGATEDTIKQYQDDINYCNLMIQKFLRLETGSLDENNISLYSSQKDNWINKKNQIIDERTRIQNIVNEARHLLPISFIEKTKGVHITSHSESYSAFYPKNNKIVLGKDSDVYTLIHELGHKYDIANDLYNDEKFVKIISNKFKKYRKNDFQEIKSKTGAYYLLKDSSEFVSRYQTRIYNNGFSRNSKVIVTSAREYFSEGIKYYYMDKEKLYLKDKNLYEYIKRLMGD